MRYEGSITDNGSKKFAMLGDDNVSASMFEVEFQEVHLSFNDLSFVQGLKPDNETYLCGESYWTGVEHEISGCNFKYHTVFDNGSTQKSINYISDNNTYWSKSDNDSYPDSFGCSRYALESTGELYLPSLCKVPPLAVVLLQEVQESGISQLGITQYLEIKI